jgi:hypothetical protein
MLQARNDNMTKNGTDMAHSWPMESPPKCEMTTWEAAPVD